MNRRVSAGCRFLELSVCSGGTLGALPGAHGWRLLAQPPKPGAASPLGPPFRARNCFQLGWPEWLEELFLSVCEVYRVSLFSAGLSSPLPASRPPLPLPEECMQSSAAFRETPPLPPCARKGAGFPGVLTTGWNPGLSGLAIPLGPLEDIFPGTLLLPGI